MVRSPMLASAVLNCAALLGLLLSAVALYAVVSYEVRQRTKEIGVRMALGANSQEIIWLFLREGFFIVLIGGVFGGALALTTMRFLEAWLFGVRPSDPLTFGVSACVLLGVTLIAGYLPARRATRADPMNCPAIRMIRNPSPPLTATRLLFPRAPSMQLSRVAGRARTGGCLIDMVDDATNSTWAQLGEQETIRAAADALRAWIERYGVPLARYVDCKNLYKRPATPGERLRGEETITQFGRMCRKLGIELIAASSPQTKGRVELVHGTHQDRLVKKLRRKGIVSHEATNVHLRSEYLARNRSAALLSFPMICVRNFLTLKVRRPQKSYYNPLFRFPR
jgi:hypothetical protein